MILEGIALRALPLVFVFAGFPATGLGQTAYHVSTTGSDAGAGTEGDPFASLSRAVEVARPGDTVFVADGHYPTGETVRIETTGHADSLLTIRAEDGARPVLDFEGVAGEGIDLRGSYVHLIGLTVENAGDNGIFVKRASNNILERMTARFNRNSGVQVEDGSAGNLILNTDSHANYDPQNHGENADGFAIKFDVGPGNVLRGCRAFDNSDDGFDFWEAGEGVTVEESWSFHNGHNVWDDADFQGDSNGFKLGHGAGAHVLIRNLAWDHLKHGFDVNGNETGVALYNNTAYLNSDRNFYFDENNPAHVLRNNVSLGGQVLMLDAIDDSVNSWNGFNVGGVDFLSLDDSSRDSERGADGALPEMQFLHPAPGSAIIDAGTNVGISFEGSAPDLGAYEYGEAITGIPNDRPGEHGGWLQVFPNPFSVETTVKFTRSFSGHRPSITVFDVAGRLVDEVQLTGSNVGGPVDRIRWRPGSSLPAGIYFLRIEDRDGTGSTIPLVFVTD